MTASLRLANPVSGRPDPGLRPDLSAAQRSLAWGLVLALHAGAATWLWRTAAEPIDAAEPATISVVVLDSVAPMPPMPVAAPTPPVPPAPPTPPQATPPVPTPRSLPAHAPSVLSAPSPSPSPMVAAPAAPAVAVTDAAAPAAPATPSPAPAVVAPAAPAAPATPKTLPSSAVRYLVPPVLSYPRASRELGESGVVRLRVLVDEQGRPREVELARSSGHPRLDQAAMQAMRAARFQPHIEDGQPRMVWVQAPLNFQLDEL